jgi:hypothetical protein
MFILLPVLCSCGSSDDTGSAPGFSDPTIPLVLVVFEEFPANTVLPWEVRTVTPDSSASLGMLATDHSGSHPDIIVSLVGEAAAEDRLLLLVDCPPGCDSTPGHRENMRIDTGPDGMPCRVEPPGIGEDISEFDWSDLLERQMAIVTLMTINLPDLVVVRITGTEPGTALEVCRIWAEQTLPGRLRVSFYSPPGPDSGRGWVVLCGPGIRNGDVIGMTSLDCLATLRVLAGLPWDPSIAQGIPSLSVMSLLPPQLSAAGP